MDTDNKANVSETTSKDVTKDTWPALRHPITEMERAVDRFFGRNRSSMWRWDDLPLVESFFEGKGQRIPTIDVIDRDTDILVRAEIPGVEKKDINVSLNDNLLTIKGQSSTEKKEEKGDYHWHEISSSSFARSVNLPGTVDVTKTSASLKDGVLEITLPKDETSKKCNIEVM